MLSDIMKRDAAKRKLRINWYKFEWHTLHWQFYDINELERRLALSGNTLDERTIETRDDIRARMRQIARDMLAYHYWPPFLWRIAVWWYYRDYVPVARLW